MMRVKVGRKWVDHGPGSARLTPMRARYDIDEQLSIGERIQPNTVRAPSLQTSYVSIEVTYGR